MKIKSGYVVRPVGDAFVALPTGDVDGFNGMIKLNGVAKFLWDFFLEEHSREEAVEALLAEYEVTRERATHDVDVFADKLCEGGVAQ